MKTVLRSSIMTLAVLALVTACSVPTDGEWEAWAHVTSHDPENQTMVIEVSQASRGVWIAEDFAEQITIPYDEDSLICEDFLESGIPEDSNIYLYGNGPDVGEDPTYFAVGCPGVPRIDPTDPKYSPVLPGFGN